MARYTFTCEHFNYNDYTGKKEDVASKHTTEFYADDLTTMLENFESFLRGAGFNFNGVLDVVNPDDAIEEFIDEQVYDDEKSVNVIKHMVNDLIKNPIKMDEEELSFVGDITLDFSNYGAAQPVVSFDYDPIDSITIPNDVCHVCGLNKQVMELHKCFDSNCPIEKAK